MSVRGLVSLYMYNRSDWQLFVGPICEGATEIAGQENAGLENDGQKCRAGKCRTGK